MPEYLSGELLARMKWKSTRRRGRAWRKRREDWGRLRSRDRADDPTDHISGSAQPPSLGPPVPYDTIAILWGLGPWASDIRLLIGLWQPTTQHIAGQESFLLADDANRCKRMPHLDRHFWFGLSENSLDNFRRCRILMERPWGVLPHTVSSSIAIIAG